MALHIKPIIKVLGLVSAIVALMMLIPAGVSVYYRETAEALAFAYVAVPVMILGFAAFKMTPAIKDHDIRMKEGFFIVGAAWIVLSVVGALPFMISGDIPRLGDAFFEVASGFSTTGSTILTDIEALAKGMAFWRSFTHWLGGMGILVLTIAIMPMLGIGGQRIMRAETTGPTMDKISFTINDSAKNLYIVYFALTVIEVVLLCLGGMNLYDSLVHSFGTMGTGGFSNYADSVGHFESGYLQMVIAVFMMLAGINFSLHYSAVKGNIHQVLRDSELRAYLAILAGSTAFIMAMLLIYKCVGDPWTAFKQSFFQVNSITTTTGYGTADFDLWPLPCRILLVALMLVGGCAGSTGGGVKVIRVIILFKIIGREIKKKLHPNAVMPIKVGGKVVAENTISAVSGFLFLYFMIIAASVFIVSFEAPYFTTAFTTVVAVISNIGPGLAAVGPTLNYAFYSQGIKIFLGLLMIAGRVEIFTVFLLFTPSYWNKNK